MNLEEEIFNNYKVDKNKLIKYGFIKDKNKYILKKYILNNKFIIIVEYDSYIKGKIIDTDFNDEYKNFRFEQVGEFNSIIKQEFINLLINIRNNCFSREMFDFQTNRIIEYINKEYKLNPEFLWDKYPNYAVFRENKKWFVVLARIPLNKINKNTSIDKEVDVINVKIESDNIETLLCCDGYYEAFHMNKKNWISIILDDTLSDDNIKNMINNSYYLVNKK